MQNLTQRERFLKPLEHIHVASSGSHCRFWDSVVSSARSVLDSVVCASIVSVISVTSSLEISPTTLVSVLESSSRSASESISESVSSYKVPSVSAKSSSQEFFSVSQRHLFSSKYAKTDLNYKLTVSSSVVCSCVVFKPKNRHIPSLYLLINTAIASESVTCPTIEWSTG